MDNSFNFSLFARGDWGSCMLATGDDASTFLQGQWSQDIRKVSEARAARGLWLDRKGKVQGEAWIAAQPGGGYLVLSPSMATTELRARLEAFIIADDVTLADVYPCSEYICVPADRAAGILSRAALPLPAEVEGAVARGKEAVLLRAPSPWGTPSVWCMVAKGDPLGLSIAAHAAEVGLRAASEAESERLRLAAGIPRVPIDCGPGDLPGEAGLDAELVCYTKGCFIGQEVLARLRAQGTLRRGLRRVSGVGEQVPARGTSLYEGERRVGELRSTVRLEDGTWRGLAMVTVAGLPERLSTQAGGTLEVSVEMQAGG